VPEPKIPRSKLYPVEENVLRAFEIGLELWDVRRGFLRADFLRDLLLGNYGSWDPCEVVITKATIQGRLDLDYCKVVHPLHFEECEFGEGISLRNSVIPFLDLDNCTVSVSEKMRQGYRVDSLDAGKLEALHVILRSGSTIKGRVSLGGANIKEQLRCSGSTIEGRLFAQGLTAEGVFLGKCSISDKQFVADDIVDMTNAMVTSRLICSSGVFKRGISLIDAKVGTYENDNENWSENALLYLNGFRYSRLEGALGKDLKEGLKWLSHMREIDENGENGEEQNVKCFHPQPYEQLMSVYRRMGHHDWAREVGFELEKRRHRGFNESNKFLSRIRKFMKPFWKWLDRFWWNRWSAILNLTIGYGYKPFRSLAWAVGLWLAGVLAFGSANLSDCGRSPSWNEIPALFLGVENRSECSVDLVRPSDGSVLAMLAAKKSIPEKYPRFVPVVYATEALFPVFDFGQLGKWHLGNIWLSVLRWVMTAGGTGLLAILALFGVGALGPQRWRGGEGG